jgi:hypothetical protein
LQFRIYGLSPSVASSLRSNVDAPLSDKTFTSTYSPSLSVRGIRKTCSEDMLGGDGSDQDRETGKTQATAVAKAKLSKATRKIDTSVLRTSIQQVSTVCTVGQRIDICNQSGKCEVEKGGGAASSEATVVGGGGGCKVGTRA